MFNQTDQTSGRHNEDCELTAFVTLLCNILLNHLVDERKKYSIAEEGEEENLKMKVCVCVCIQALKRCSFRPSSGHIAILL